jgi:hypothetical protein
MHFGEGADDPSEIELDDFGKYALGKFLFGTLLGAPELHQIFVNGSFLDVKNL